MEHSKGEVTLMSDFKRHVAQLPRPWWKPFSIKPASLIFLLSCSAGIMAGTEVLIRRSNNNGSVLSFELHPASSCGELNESCPYAESSISNILYFCYKYLPILLAVILAAIWEAFVLDIQRIEPFFQLSRPDGALAADSLLLNYTQIFLPKVPFVALRKEHYLVFVSFLCLLFVGMLAPIFQSGIFSVSISPEDGEVWLTKVHTNNTYCRLLQSLHGITILLTVWLFILSWRRQITGLYSNPGSVASLAAVVGPTLVEDFRNLDLQENKQITQILSKRRYKLCSLTGINGAVVYQLERIPHQQNIPAHNPHYVKEQEHQLDKNPQKLETIIPDARVNMSVTVTLTYCIMITASVFFGVETFSKTSTRAIFSQKLVPVAVAVILKQCWKPLDRGVRNLEPFNHLSQHPLAHRQNFNDFRRVFRSPCNIKRGIKIFPGKAEDTIFLDYSSSSFLTAPIEAMLNGHFSVFLVTFVSWLVEIFTVTMGSLGTLPCYMHRKCPSSSPTDVSPKAVSVSVGLSFGILLTITLMTLFVCTPRLMASYIPQQVENMAEVLRWLYSSRMVAVLRPMSTMNPSQCRKFRKEMSGRKFGLGWIGPKGFGIDEEPVEAFSYSLGELGKREIHRYRPEVGA